MAELKRFHLFLWWLHLEQCGDQIPYEASFETLEAAKAACNHDDNAQVFVTQPDGSLQLAAWGYQRGKMKQWEWFDAS